MLLNTPSAPHESYSWGVIQWFYICFFWQFRGQWSCTTLGPAVHPTWGRHRAWPVRFLFQCNTFTLLSQYTCSSITMQLSFYTSAYHGHLMSLIDISPYKFRKLAGQKEWVHVVCKFIRLSFHKLRTDSGVLCLGKNMFHPPRHLYQTPTEACTERTIQTQAKRMLIQSKT